MFYTAIWIIAYVILSNGAENKITSTNLPISLVATMKTDIAEGYNGMQWIITVLNTLSIPIRIDHISADVYFKQSLEYHVALIPFVVEYHCQSTTTYGHLQDLYDEDGTKNWTDHQISGNGKKTFLGIIEPVIGSGYRGNGTICLDLYPFSCCFATLQAAYICKLNDVKCPSQGLNLPYIEIEFYSNITISINDTFTDTIAYNQPFFPLYATPQYVIAGDELCCTDFVFYATINPTISPTINSSVNPTMKPTMNPTMNPSVNPSVNPTMNPTTKMATTSDPSSAPIISVSEYPTSDPTQNPTNQRTDDDKSSNLHVLIYVIVVIIALIAIGLLVYCMVLFAKKQNKMNEYEELLMENLNEEAVKIHNDAYKLLEQWSLEQYANVLIDEKGYDDVTEWKNITINDLQNMGFKEGHCRKFVKKINETMSDHEEMQQPEGQIYTNQ